MGTATTMSSLTEAMGMMLPGSAAIPAPYRDRQEVAYHTGKRIVEMVAEDLKPSDIMTPRGVSQRDRGQFRDRRLDQCARSIWPPSPATWGSTWSCEDWETYGYNVPLLVNLQPAGEYLGRGLLPRRRACRRSSNS